MVKNKTLISLLVSLIFGLALAVRPVSATGLPKVSIVHLPTYTVSNGFTLSYSALSDDPSSISAQFSYQRDGGPFIPFGAAISGANGTVGVTSDQMPADGSYCFEVNITSSSGNASDPVPSCTIYDSIHPANPYNYGKSQVGTTTMRIRWTNPGDADYDVTYIYRGEQPNFSADEGHKIGGLGGAPNADMSYDDTGLDLANKTYYYIIRSFDKAGNGSGLIGDSTTTTSVLGTNTSAGKATVLPKQGQSGQILSGATESPTPSSVSAEEPSVSGASANVLGGSSKTKTIGIVVGLGALVVAAYFIFKKRAK